jgi:hypothetical protein
MFHETRNKYCGGFLLIINGWLTIFQQVLMSQMLIFNMFQLTRPVILHATLDNVAVGIFSPVVP